MRIIKSLTISACKNLNFQKIPLYSYVQTRTQPKKSYQKRQQDQQTRYNINRKIDQSYWQALLPTLQPSASKIINILLNPKSSQKQISRQLQQYLQFRNTTFTQKIRSDRGCIAMLVAMNQSINSENSEQYENRIVDFVTLTDIKTNPYDGVMLKHLMIAISKRINMNIQKNIRQYYRLRLVEILTDNFQRSDNKDLMLMMKIIQESMEKDKLNFITKWRFYPLLQAILTRVTSLMQAYVNTTEFESKKSIQQIITPSFFYKIIQLVYYYGYITLQNGSKIYNFLVNCDSTVYSEHNITINLFNTICYIPYVEVPNSQNTTSTIRKKLLSHFEAKYNQSANIKKSWYQYPVSARRYTIQKFFQDEFHSTFKSLPFQKFQDKYLLLKKQHLVRPALPNFVWRLFKQNQKAMLDKHILNHCITKLYPQKVSLPKAQWPDLSQRRTVISTDNESNLKIWQALTKLGYKFKKQQNCAQRRVDLLIDDEIAIQIDGQGHYTFLNKQLSPQTSYRNLQLLLSGYKVVIISMFQYNNNRQVQDLQKLIKEKVQLIRNHGYVYVC